MNFRFAFAILIAAVLTACATPPALSREGQGEGFPTVPPALTEPTTPVIPSDLPAVAGVEGSPSTITPIPPTDPAQARNTRSLIATRAAELAMATMPGPYSWEEFRTCSTFVSAYMRQLSFPVNGLNGQYANHPDPFPWSGTVEQVSWARRNFAEFTHDAPLKDFLEGKLWDQLMPGDVIYLQTAIGHNGYNSYYHAVVLVGYDNAGSPVFAELAAGMSNASTVRTFDQMTGYYARDAAGNWNVDPYPSALSSPLLVTWFDPLAILNRGQLWQKPGAVVPNSDIVSAHFDDLITINIYDGTATLWEQLAGVWLSVPLDGRNQFYAVLGRFLPANNLIGSAFLQQRKVEIYDGDYGVYFSNKGVYQHTWTPQMLARISGFDYINGFGGLSGSTLTALMTPQIYRSGELIDNWDYSSFTFHRIPDVVNQDMLLRVDLLKAANTPSSPNFGPISVPQVYLSSGCINFDETTWTILETYLQDRLDIGHRVGVIFSYPNFDQSLLPTLDLFKQAFTGGEFNKWCPIDSDQCDGFDRRNYRQTYLD